MHSRSRPVKLTGVRLLPSINLRRHERVPITYVCDEETLLRARAIETQSYVLAPAQAGEHFAGRMSYGRAMIVDPWGTILAQCKEFDYPQTEVPGGEEDELAIAEYVSIPQRPTV